MDKINIILADDHTLVRQGIKTLLKKNKDFNIVAEAKDGIETLQLLAEHQADVILLDLSMPFLTGFDAIPQIKEQFPSVKIIILTMHEEASYITMCVQKGANGYLFKNTEPSELYHSIYSVVAGENYFTAAVSKILISGIAQGNLPSESSRAKLSEREIEVLKYIVDGLSAKMVADKLSISSRTVETHKVNIMRKLEVANTAELVSKVFQENLFDKTS